MLVEVIAPTPELPLVGCQVLVEIRNVSLADARAETLGSAVGTVGEESVRHLTVLQVSVSRLPVRNTVWVHLPLIMFSSYCVFEPALLIGQAVKHPGSRQPHD